MPDTALWEARLERAAALGAAKVLSDLGLDDEDAHNDIRELRSLISAWRGTKTEVWNTVVKWGTMLFLGAISAVLYAKFGVSFAGSK